jgi:hypothetical protein
MLPLPARSALYSRRGRSAAPSQNCTGVASSHCSTAPAASSGGRRAAASPSIGSHQRRRQQQRQQRVASQCGDRRSAALRELADVGRVAVVARTGACSRRAPPLRRASAAVARCRASRPAARSASLAGEVDARTRSRRAPHCSALLHPRRRSWRRSCPRSPGATVRLRHLVAGAARSPRRSARDVERARAVARSRQTRWPG